MRLAICAVLCLGWMGMPVCAQPAKKGDLIAGKSKVLRASPKHFAAFQAADLKKRTVRLILEGEKKAKDWPLTPEAEVKMAGWWARLDHFTPGDRVWAWFAVDRQKKPTAIYMICDELSEQDMHGAGVVLESRDGKSITVKPVKKKSRTIPAGDAKVFTGKGPKATPSSLDSLKPGQAVYVQTADGKARLIYDTAGFEALRRGQKARLRQQWIKEGIPATVSIVHRFTGEFEVLLDHEGMRWGRSLKPGAKVSIDAKPPIPAVVRQMQPWHERTQLKLVGSGFDLADLEPGQRIQVKMPAPPQAVEESKLPPDIDTARPNKHDRIEWFLASTYCTCKVGGDGCTGMFYTLASCNPNACGMPNLIRRKIGAMIDKGLTDRQIFEALLKERGTTLIRPHLLP